jgi:CheY-like chemotaxis protein
MVATEQIGNRAIILVVDDLESNRETLRELLEGLDFRIIEARDGYSALRMAADTPPDLVLLDVMMPGMDGFEVCRRLRGEVRLAEVPVIMVTALDDQASRLAGLKAGADDFLTKPYNRTELHARARTITRLNRYRRLHESHAAQRDSEKHFRALFERGPVATYTCDTSGTIRDFNRRAVELWGWEPKANEAYAQYCGSVRLYYGDGRSMPHNECPMALVLTGKLAHTTDTELVIGRPDGSRVSVLVNTLPLYNDAGYVSGAISCFHYLSELKAASGVETLSSRG